MAWNLSGHLLVMPSLAGSEVTGGFFRRQGLLVITRGMAISGTEP